MDKNEEWDDFLSNLLTNAVEEFKSSREYEYLKKRQVEIEEMLTTNLNSSQKIMIDEILLEIGIYSERETNMLYRKGFKDCVWLLKNLGVLA